MRREASGDPSREPSLRWPRSRESGHQKTGAPSASYRRLVAPTSTPAPVTGARLELLRSLGFGELQHDSHVPFLSHLIGTRRLLASWGARPALCDAGLFHSVYGTEYFEPDRTADRESVTAIIGAEAERIAWLWCNIERATLDPVAATARLRTDGRVEPLTE